MEKLPNFFIVGAPKAGTTSLYEYLKNIPGIFMSPVKEPNYFSVNTVPDNHPILKPIRDKKKYLQLFEKVTNEKIVGEASPDYLADKDTPSLIHQIIPDARILISLRDPVERAFSDYLIHLRQGLMKLSFHEELQNELNQKIDLTQPNCRLEYGFYFQSVQRYLEVFDSTQIKIIIFEEFIKDTKAVIKDILQFLDVNSTLNDFDDEVHNPYQGPRGSVAQHLLTSETASKISKKILPSSTRRMIREKILISKKPKPNMEHQDRDRLIKYYLEDVKKLENLLDKKLPWINFNNDEK